MFSWGSISTRHGAGRVLVPRHRRAPIPADQAWQPGRSTWSRWTRTAGVDVGEQRGTARHPPAAQRDHSEAVGMTGVRAVAAGNAASSTQERRHGAVLGQPGLDTGCQRDRESGYLRESKGLANIVDIVSGNGHVLALRADGRMFAFGDNRHGQLGNCTHLCAVRDASRFPGQCRRDGGRMAFSLAVTGDGKVWYWGRATNFGDDPVSHRSHGGCRSARSCRVRRRSGFRPARAARRHGPALRASTTRPGTLDVPVRIQGLAGITSIEAEGRGADPDGHRAMDASLP